MNLSCRRLLAGLFAVLGLAACQPSLKSDLPVGPAAYQVLSPETAALPTGPYLLRAGDHIAINVYQEADLTQADLPIDEAGMVSVPLVGEIRAEGRTVTALANEIQTAYGRRYLRDPKVSVMLRELRDRLYAVEGQVTKPGQFVFQPGTTLLSAIATAGSPSDAAKLDEVLVFRMVEGQRAGGRFNLTDIRAGRAADPRILPGDVIVVGFSSVRGIYRDILQAAPVFGLFTIF